MTSSYPLHVDATLQPDLSRGLWLVKWLLAIPHYVVLAFLWVAFIVLSSIAFFAILFTGRYPRAIFDFNVGVLRWSWRVAFYAYAALGTDRYPPFTLADVPDYPAHLSVEYPERLSRGLVLVKWWLLALPHYLVVALLVGGGWYADRAADRDGPMLWGLIGILVAIAAVVLLFTGRYPRSIFDLVLGLNRWVLRVAAYASLMTDEYPPFRLDMGGQDPGVLLGERPWVAASGPPPSPPGERGRRGQWTGGRIAAVVAGSVALVTAAGLVIGGVALAVADKTQRDNADYFISDSVTLKSRGFAVVSEPLEMGEAGPVDVPHWLVGDLRLRVTPDGQGALFVGLAPTADVRGYLADVQHTTLGGFMGKRPRYQQAGGGAPTTAPDELGIWETSVHGNGTRTLTWPVESGDWTIVVMNENASAPVAAKMAAGATVPALGWVIGGLLSAGGLFLLVGLSLVLGAVRAVSGVGERE